MTNEQTEVWRIVPEFSAYEVSNKGRVRRRTAKGRWGAGHILSPGEADNGHLYVMLTDDAGKIRKQFIHRLVANAFIGAASFADALVLHHNDVPTHNTPDNLYWGDHAQNAVDAKLNRKSPPEVSQQGAQRGEANSSAVLSEANVIQIKRYLKMGLCGACIARIYGVNKETIYSIAKGRTWRHLHEVSAR